MILFANAKINLGLHVLAKREDGFHDIESLKYPIPLFDVIEILPSESFELDILGKKIEGELENNLIWKAYNLIRLEKAIPPVRIVLQKNIPMGAGLGGGSANASFILKGLRDYFKLDFDDEKLKKLASQLGSDCPFFIDNIPQIASGKGEILNAFDFSLKGLYLYLIHPDIHIGTEEAYSGVQPKKREFNWETLKKKDFAAWKKGLTNDFEASVFALYPEIGELKDELYKHGAVYASMSGSGSSVYGLFETKPETIEINYSTQLILNL